MPCAKRCSRPTQACGSAGDRPSSGHRARRPQRRALRRCAGIPRLLVGRAVVAGAVLVSFLLAFQFASRPGPLQLTAFIDNPITLVPRAALDAVAFAGLAVTVPLVVACAGMLVARFRRSVGIEREQLKWLAFAALPLVALGPLSSIGPGKPVQILSAVSQMAVPVAIRVALLRCRL